MVALNLQTRDENFAINSAFFEQNSGCGYVLKPVFERFSTMHNVQFVKYDVTVSFMAQVLDTVTYLVPQVLDTAS